MKNLKKLRQQYGISQEKLALEFYTTQQAIYKYEAGLSQPDVQRMIEFSDFFHTSVDYMIGHTNDPRPYPSDAPDNLTPDEFLLVETYRVLPCDVRNHHLALMRGYASLLYPEDSENIKDTNAEKTKTTTKNTNRKKEPLP